MMKQIATNWVIALLVFRYSSHLISLRVIVDFLVPSLLAPSSSIASLNSSFLIFGDEKDCAYSHFNSNPNCPSCGRLLGENDFTDLVISDKSSKLATNPDEIMQSLLTKTSLQPGAPMTFSDMAARVLHEQDALLENKKLFVNVSRATSN